MSYFALSFTHKNTALELREQLSLDTGRKNELLKLILASSKINECVLLSTCNRTEILCDIEEGALSVGDYLLKCLALVCKIPFEIISNLPDLYEDSGFIHHLFSVASSLDSIVIGETQIVSQLKDALSFSARFYPCSKLQVAIASAFKCAANVRSQTQISKHKVSISSVATEHAKANLSTKNPKILIIGSGEMGRLCAKHLNMPCDIASRTLKNAQKLSNEIKNSSVVDFAQLDKKLNDYDLIFSATSSSLPFLHAKMFDKKPRFIYDIAVPRDSSFNHSENTKVICVDDLKNIVNENMALKEEQAKLAYKIVANCLREFYAKEQELAVVPIIKAMRKAASRTSDEQLEIARKKGYLKDCDFERVKRFCEQLFNAYLHEPTIRLKSANDYDCDVLKYIFDVKDENEIL